MKTLTKLFVCASLFATFAFADSIDGKWVSERKMQDRTITQTFDLKADGGKLTGKIQVVFGEMEPRTSDIQDGKVDGKNFSFSATMQGPNGEVKTMYKGTVEGDALKGTSMRDGGQERPFEAKKK